MKVILLTPDQHYFQAILDRLQFDGPSKDAVLISSTDEALRILPENEPCIIVSESYTTHSGNEPKTYGVEKLAQDVKAKNPKCIIIIYAVDMWDIDESLFDDTIHSLDKNSYELLFKKLRQYCKT